MWCLETLQQINSERTRLAKANLPEAEALFNVTSRFKKTGSVVDAIKDFHQKLETRSDAIIVDYP
jgi:predicted O-methyltransferase YrrM